jgi:hypothetical protein
VSCHKQDQLRIIIDPGGPMLVAPSAVRNSATGGANRQASRFTTILPNRAITCEPQGGNARLMYLNVQTGGQCEQAMSLVRHSHADLAFRKMSRSEETGGGHPWKVGGCCCFLRFCRCLGVRRYRSTFTPRESPCLLRLPVAPIWPRVSSTTLLAIADAFRQACTRLGCSYFLSNTSQLVSDAIPDLARDMAKTLLSIPVKMTQTRWLLPRIEEYPWATSKLPNLTLCAFGVVRDVRYTPRETDWSAATT